MNNNSLVIGGIGKLAGNVTSHKDKKLTHPQEPPRHQNEAHQNEATENGWPHCRLSEPATTGDASHFRYSPQNTPDKVFPGGHYSPDDEVPEKSNQGLPQSIGASQTSSKKTLTRHRIKWWMMLVLSVASLTCGVNFSFGGIVLPQLTQLASDDLFLNTLEVSLFSSLSYLGIGMGACLVWPLQPIVGHRIILALGLSVYAAAWLATSLTTSVWLLLLARTTQGMTMSFILPSVMTYTVETAHKNYRGTLAATIYMFSSVGFLMPAIITTVNLTWRQTGIVFCVMCIVPIFGVLFLPDSPRWLMTRGRDTDALNTLIHLRGDSHEAESEYQDIATQVTVEGHGGICHQTKMLFQAPTRHTLGLLLVIAACSCFGGSAVIFAYLVPLLQIINPNTDSYQISIVCLLLRLMGAVLVLAITDRIGRKPCLTVGFTNTALSFGMISLYFFLQKLGVSGIGWLPIAGIVIILFSDGNIYTILLTVEGELLPLSCRSIGVLLVTCVRGISGLTSIYTYETVTQALGMDGAFLLYGAVCAVLPFITGFGLKETRGASLEELTTPKIHTDNTMKTEQKALTV